MRLKSKHYKTLANISIIAILIAAISIAFADIAPPGPRPDNNPFTLDNFIYTLKGHPPTSEHWTEMGRVDAEDMRWAAIDLGISPDSRYLLWVIERNTYQGVVQSANITQGETMQEYLIPGSSGELIFEETYPDGENESSSLGYVRESYEYRLEFSAEAPGKYVQRFQVNGEYSNPIIFNAQAAPVPQPTS